MTFGLDGEGGPVAGVDEVGRGPLAGPVVAAAVILDPETPIPGVTDSKKLAGARREELAEHIRAGSRAWAIAEVAPDEIDRMNILQASLHAMKLAVDKLALPPVHVLVDGRDRPPLSVPSESIIGGDARIPAIGAASILAKVYRDELMVRAHERYPVYGFDGHKGYPTKSHLENLTRHGPCDIHRRSFAPVRNWLDGNA